MEVIESQFNPHQFTPSIEVQFPTSARTDAGVPLIHAVKDLPGRKFNPDERCWSITATGTKLHPNDVLESIGIALDTELDPWWNPVAVHEADTTWRVYPRLAGATAVAEHLRHAGIWDESEGCYRVDATDLTDGDRIIVRGLIVDDPEHVIATAARMREPAQIEAEPSLIADLVDAVKPDDELLEEGYEAIGDFRAGFGGESQLMKRFQVSSGMAAAASVRMICHGMGAGKTIISMAAVDLMRAQRLLVVAPTVAATHWQREINTWLSPVFARIAPDQLPGTGKAGEAGPWVRRVVASRKHPDVPGTGALIVPSSMLNSKGVEDLINEFNADALIVDESHLFKTWDSARSQTIRRIARKIPKSNRLAITGTPILNSPAELINQLAITGQLETEFGSRGSFLARYVRFDKFGRPHGLKKHAAELNQRMSRLWMMKTKQELLPHLKGKTHDWRVIDIDEKTYRAAHAEVIDTVIERLGGNEACATMKQDTVDAFIHDSSVALLAPMRRAAASAKVPVAVELVEEMLASGDDSPVIVFAHHQEPIQEFLDHAQHRGLECAVIDGSTTADERGNIVDDFQAGELDVLIGSIAAAGVAITLTASHRIVFIEHDWVPGNNAQAMDRADRNGQTELVEITHLIAAGTVDDQVHSVLARKIDEITTITGESELGEAQQMDATINDVISEIVHQAQVTARRRTKNKTAKH